MKKAATGAMGLSVGSTAFASNAASYRRIIGANDRLDVAIVGLGRRLGAFYEPVGMEESNVRLRYLCDVMESQRTKAAEKFKEFTEDEPKLVTFHERLSERSVYLRYASLMKLEERVAHERLARICFIDYHREMALVAERCQPETNTPHIIGVGRLTKIFGTNDAEFALVISDSYQRRGIGSEMLKRLIAVARDEGLDRITADILEQNTAMAHLSEKLGFEVVRNTDPDDPMLKAVKWLKSDGEKV